MRLGDPRQWIDLQLAGYESPDLVTTQEDDDVAEDHWLILRAEVVRAEARSNYDAISLTVEEIKRLIQWLNDVALGQLGPSSDWNDPTLAFSVGAVVAFVEPDLAARVIGRRADAVRLRWYLADVGSTQDLSEDSVFSVSFMSYKATAIDVVTSPIEIQTAADDLSAALFALTGEADR